jgi:ribosomal protein S18 acetylase RimI-like enzyme
MPQPAGVRVLRAGLDDAQEVARFQAPFDNEVLAHETRRFLADERHHLLLGYVDEVPAGFVSAADIFHPDKGGEIFLNEIGVMDDWRRRGVARALVEELKRLGHERRCGNMWVLTDEDNAAAMGLYLSTDGHWDGSPQVMFEYDLGDG